MASLLTQVIVLGLACAPALAQRHHVHHYTEIEGLPSGHVHGLEQAADGRMWFSTRLGMATYDGARWESVEAPFPAAPGLLEADAEGGLWVIPYSRPLMSTRYADGKMTRFPKADLLIQNYGLLCVQGIDERTVFVGTRTCGLTGWVDGEWRRYPLGGESEYTTFALEHRGQELLVGTSTGLWRLDLTDLQRAAERITSIPEGDVLGLLFDGEVTRIVSNTWVGSLRDGEYTQLFTGSDAFAPYVAPLRLDLDRRGGLYLGHTNRLAYLTPAGELSDLDTKSGLLGAGAQDVEVDREGNAWIAGLRGVSKIVTRTVQSYNSIHGLFDDEVSAILTLPGNATLLGHNGGLSLMQPDGIETLDFQAGPVLGRVMDLEPARDGTIWVATTGLGLGRYTVGAGVEWSPLPTGAQIHSVIDDGASVWVGAVDGVWQFTEGEFRHLDGDPLLRTAVRRIVARADGTIFCATMNQGIFSRHPNGEVEHWSSGDIDMDNTYNLLLRPGHSTLVASQGGVLEARDGILVPSTTCPVDVPSYLLVEDEERDTIWVGTGRGVVQVGASGLRRIGPRDGLAGPEANRDAGLVDKSGRFWVGTDRGLSIVWPTVYEGDPPSVSFLGATYAGAHFDLDVEPIHCGAPARLLRLSFRSTAFLDEVRTRFRYRMEGLDSEWTGPTTVPTRELSYPALPAGTYRLHLQAIGVDGRESEVIISPPVIIPAPLYERLWFQAVLILLAIGAIWGLVAQRVQRGYSNRLAEQVRVRTAQLEESESNLEADRQRLAAMLTSIADGVAATDTEDCIILWNAAAQRITGRTTAEVMGCNLHEVLGAESPFPQCGVVQFEAQATNAQGRILEASSAPLASDGAVVAFRDVTARMTLERDMARTQRLESLGLLAGGIAHDFNNYLTVVIGTLGMLREEPALSADQRDQVCVAEQTMNRAVSLTQQLLTFSTGGAPLRQDVVVEELLADAVAFALSGSNVVAHIEVQPEMRRAHVDPGQMSQLLHNLLLNARQAMPEGGALTLRAHNVADPPHDLEDGEWVAIEVEDDGPGMPRDLQARIFEPFFSQREGGTGLGLAIAHSIVSRHGGRITVNSAPGRGTRFEIVLPGVAPQPAADRPSIVTAPSSPARVLVMDDDESIRAMLTRMLLHLGHRCVAVGEGSLAIDAYMKARADDDPFSAVLLDLTIIGGRGGRETARRILELAPDASLVATSGYSNDAVLGDHSRFGFQAAMAKPFRLEDLRNVLAQVIDPNSPGERTRSR